MTRRRAINSLRSAWTQRFRRLGLQRRIMLYVCASLFAVLAVYGLLDWQAVRQSTDLVFQERLMVARTTAHQMDSDLAHLQRELSEVGESVGDALAANQPGEARDAVQTMRRHWLRYDRFDNPCSITLTDPDGIALWADPPTADLLVLDRSRPPSLQAAFRSQQPFIADEFAPGANGLGSLWLVTPVRSSGQVIGFLVAEINLSQISQRFTSALDPRYNGHELELIDEAGVVLAATQPERQWRASEHAPLFSEMLARRQAGVVTHTPPAGSAELAHVIAFVPLSGPHWGLVVEEEQDAALAVPRALQDELVIFGLIVLGGGLALAWVTTRAVVRPINTLISATQHIATGDLDYPLDGTGEDEVGRLARSFDEMRVHLKQSRDEIARWNLELEARVQQRTRELAALVKSSHALTSTLHLDALFQILMPQVREILPAAEGIALFLFDTQTQTLAARSTFGFDPVEGAALRFRLGEAIAGQVFDSQTPALLKTVDRVRAAQANFSAENRARFRRAAGEREAQSALGVPLVSKGARLGTLTLYSFSREAAFGDGDIAILQALAAQASAAIENAQLYAALQEKEMARAQLLEKVIQAQEDERQRVAREIHDELGQLLTRLSINLKMCEAQVPTALTGVREQLTATQTLVWQTIEQAHRLIVELRPTLLDELGLEAALREEMNQRLTPLGVVPVLSADCGALERLPAPVAIALFRIAQEAISNIARHAQAQHAAIALRRDASHLQVVIEDDGVGLPADLHARADGHRPLGLLGMYERAALLGGTLAIEPRAPHGARVIVRVPLGAKGMGTHESDPRLAG